MSVHLYLVFLFNLIMIVSEVHVKLSCAVKFVNTDIQIESCESSLCVSSLSRPLSLSLPLPSPPFPSLSVCVCTKEYSTCRAFIGLHTLLYVDVKCKCEVESHGSMNLVA